MQAAGQVHINDKVNSPDLGDGRPHNGPSTLPAMPAFLPHISHRHKDISF